MTWNSGNSDQDGKKPEDGQQPESWTTDGWQASAPGDQPESGTGASDAPGDSEQPFGEAPNSFAPPQGFGQQHGSEQFEHGDSGQPAVDFGASDSGQVRLSRTFGQPAADFGDQDAGDQDVSPQDAAPGHDVSGQESVPGHDEQAPAPSVDFGEPAGETHQPAEDYGQRPDEAQQPAADFGVPAANFGAPAADFGAPAADFGSGDGPDAQPHDEQPDAAAEQPAEEPLHTYGQGGHSPDSSESAFAAGSAFDHQQRDDAHPQFDGQQFEDQSTQQYDRSQFGDQPTHAYDQSGSAPVNGDQQAGDHRFGDQQFGEQPTQAYDQSQFGEQHSGDQQFGGQQFEDQSTQQYDRSQFGDQQFGEQPTQAYDQSQFGQAHDGQHAGDHPYGGQQFGEQPTQAYDQSQFGQAHDGQHGDQQFGNQPTQAYDQSQGWGATGSHAWEPGNQQGWQQPDEQPNVFGAPPAALPGDQNAPFYAGAAGAAAGAGGMYAAGAGNGGNGSGGPRDPNQPGHPDGASESKKKPWYKRPVFFIPIIALVVVIIAAAILTPIIINNNNRQRGDELAAAFQEDVDAYRATWNEENLAVVSSVNLSDPLSAAGRTFYDFNEENRAALDESCADIATAKEQRQALVDADVPELPADEGATASDAYVQAQDEADALASKREDADAFLSQSESALNSFEEFCNNYPAYADLYDEYENNVATTLEDAYTVENGDRIETNDGSVYYLCESASGCTDLYNDDTRETFAAALETTYVGFYTGLADLYATQCFSSDFQVACDAGATGYQEAADAYQAIVDHLRTTEPTVEVGETLYPELAPLSEAAVDAEIAAETAFLEAWVTVEDTGFSMSSTGASLGEHFADKNAQLDELAAAVLE